MFQVRRLEKVIEGRSALSIEQLDINGGEVVAVTGPINSGKTLLVRLLSGQLLPSGGTVTLDGQDIYRVPAARQRIGVLFEEDLLYDRQSARQNLGFICQLRNLPRARIDEMLALVGLNDQANTAVSKLSPPAQRRLAFARVLLERPQVLLLDQPTLRADWDTQALFARLIKQVAEEGAAVLLTDEDLTWAGKFCTHVVELEGGRVANRYTPGERAEGGAAHAHAAEEANGSAAEPVIPAQLVPYKIPARREDRILFYDPGEILYFMSREGKTVLRTTKEEATTNLTLQELEQRLNGRGFFKAHRAYLVNLQHIKAVIQYTRNSFTLQLNDAQETMIPLSKQSEKELQELLGY